MTSKGPPVIQFHGQAPPPTSFGAPPGAPSAPGAPMGFSNAPPTSFGMPQPYSQTSAPYPTQPMHPTPSTMPASINNYPSQQMPYPSQSMPMPSYPPTTHVNPSAQSFYPQQQNYDMYPNLQRAPDAREYFNNMASSPYPTGSNVQANSSVSHQGGNYHGGQGIGSGYHYTGNSSTDIPRGITPAPRNDRFTPKVRLMIL